MTLPPAPTDGASNPRAPVPAAATPEPTAGVTARRRRRPIDPKLLLASLAIACGLVLIGFGLLRSVSGDQAADLPAAIERVTPAVDAVQVLRQTQVIVDLADGYEGRMIIDGIELDTIRLDELVAVDVEPGTQVDVPPGAVFEPGNATLTFTPGDGAPIERFSSQVHLATVIYWKAEDGPDTARSYSWSFEVI